MSDDSKVLRNEYLSILRHELRTPINHIIGYAELLLEEAADAGSEAGVPDLENIREAGNHLLIYINTILDPAQLAAGTTDEDEINRNLRTPLNTILGYSELLQEEATEQGLAEFIPDLQKIHTAGINLLDRVNTLIDLARLEFTIGAADGSEHSSETQSNDAQAVARQISQTAGTVGGLASSASDRSEKNGVASDENEPGRLLVVDDNEMNRDMLSRRLKRLGYSVEEASSGVLALELLREKAFDLVMLDILMPEMDGFEVLAALKADSALRSVPVIVLSAMDELKSAVTCIEMGAEDYLPKPFNPVLLRARTSACLEKKRFHDQEVHYLQQIDAERKRADELLHVILPAEIVDELKTANAVRPRRHEHVAMMFCDVVSFTQFCDGHEADEVVAPLQQLVESFEEITVDHDLQKIKTIGDAFMAAAGLLKPLPNPVLSCVQAGIAMVNAAGELPSKWSVRVGIHVGPLVAGVIGKRQYLYDVWGDTVNMAARMESHGVADAVVLSSAAWREVSDWCWGTSLGVITVKGKGDVEIFRCDGLRSSPPLSLHCPSRQGTIIVLTVAPLGNNVPTTRRYPDYWV